MTVPTAVPAWCLLITVLIRSDKCSDDFNTSLPFTPTPTALRLDTKKLLAKELKNGLSWRDRHLKHLKTEGKHSATLKDAGDTTEDIDTNAEYDTTMGHNTTVAYNRTEEYNTAVEYDTTVVYKTTVTKKKRTENDTPVKYNTKDQTETFRSSTEKANDNTVEEEVLEAPFRSSRIMVEDYPFVATIWLRYERPEYHAVGSMISLRHVLTAAHSVCWNADTRAPIPFNNLMMGVRVGSMHYNESFVEHDVLYSHIHWKWWASRRKSRLYDIAVLELSREIELTPRSGLVQLATWQDISLMNLMRSTTRCVTVWWALLPNPRLDHLNPSYPYLERAQTKLISFTECDNLLSKYGADKINTTLEICTKTKEIEGSCPGNTGGPLICEGKQIGVISRGDGCLKEPRPQVHTRVDELFDWVQLKLSHQEGRLLRKVTNGTVGRLLSSQLFYFVFITVFYLTQ